MFPVQPSPGGILCIEPWNTPKTPVESHVKVTYRPTIRHETPSPGVYHTAPINAQATHHVHNHTQSQTLPDACRFTETSTSRSWRGAIADTMLDSISFRSTTMGFILSSKATRASPYWSISCWTPTKMLVTGCDGALRENAVLAYSRVGLIEGLGCGALLSSGLWGTEEECCIGGIPSYRKQAMIHVSWWLQSGPQRGLKMMIQRVGLRCW